MKSHETAKLDISRPNDFNSLWGPWRNKIASQAKLIVSQAKFSLRLRNLPAVLVGCGDSMHIEIRADRSRS